MLETCLEQAIRIAVGFVKVERTIVLRRVRRMRARKLSSAISSSLRCVAFI